jgi:hypothetical protein
MRNLLQNKASSGNDELLESSTLVFENPEQARGYTVVSNAVLFDPTVSPGAKTTYALLLSFAWQAARAFPGQQRLAKILGVSDRHVRRYLSELIAKAYIQVKRRGLGKTNLYMISDLSRIGRITSAGEKQEQALPKVKSEADRTQVSDQERTPMSDKQDTEEQDTELSKYRKIETPAKISREIYSDQIAHAVDGLSKRELNDPIHVKSNITQAQNLWRDSKSSEEEFVALIQAARQRTFQHSGIIYKTTDGGRGAKNRAPYFFKVLKGLVREAMLANFRHRFKSPP